MASFIHLRNVLSTFYMLGTPLGAENADKVLVLIELIFLMERDNKQVNT